MKSSEIAEVCWFGIISWLINVWFCGVDGVLVRLKRENRRGPKGEMKKRMRGIMRSKEGGGDEGHVNFPMRERERESLFLFGECQQSVTVEEEGKY